MAARTLCKTHIDELERLGYLRLKGSRLEGSTNLSSQENLFPPPTSNSISNEDMVTKEYWISIPNVLLYIFFIKLFGKNRSFNWKDI